MRYNFPFRELLEWHISARRREGDLTVRVEAKESQQSEERDATAMII